MAKAASNRVNSANMPRSQTPSFPAPHRATVSAGFVTGMLSGLRSKGIDPLPLLRAAGVAPTCLVDRGVRIPIANYAALYNLTVREFDDEGFALFHAPLRLGTFEFLCRSVVGSATLGEALGRTARFLRVVLPDLEVAFERGAHAARLKIEESLPRRVEAGDPRRVFAFEWLLRLLHGLSCWLVGRGLSLDTVRFPYPRPPHAADYALIYTEHSEFGGALLVASFEAALLDLPVRRDHSDLEAFLEGAPGKITLLYRRDREMVRSVREFLAKSLSSAPGFEEVARELRISPRTLHRRLHEEGASFRAIKDALRRELALARLEKTRLSVARIAAELGYSEPSAFFRAFHAWTGEAPSAHRKRSARPR